MEWVEGWIHAYRSGGWLCDLGGWMALFDAILEVLFAFWSVSFFSGLRTIWCGHFEGWFFVFLSAKSLFLSWSFLDSFFLEPFGLVGWLVLFLVESLSREGWT